MLEPSRPTTNETSVKLPPRGAPDALSAAKWPPPDDDDDAPAGGGGAGAAGGGGGGPIGPYEGDFKKGRFNGKVVLVGFVLALVAAGLAVVATKTESEKLTVEQVVAAKKAAYLMTKAERTARWKELAKPGADYELRSEALQQLAWADDKDGVGFAAQALADTDHRIRGVAAQVLAYYGTPAADSAKDALTKALGEADDSDRPQIVWSLVALKDARVFDKAMELYRAGYLAKVQRLGGGPAFDAEKLAALVSLDTLAAMVGDPSDSVRQLVATSLSRTGEAKWTAPLIKLVQDPVVDVAREAATGLGKIADEKARGPLLDALAKADKDSRQKFLEALRDGIGGEGLVIALGSVSKARAEITWHQTSQLFEMLKKIADPRVGDSLAAYLATKPHQHWETEAALRLAEVGDLRAVPYLAERMKRDPLKVYGESFDYEKVLRRDDKERVVSARMLADLAILHPEAKADIRAKAEDAMIGWLHEKPEPHANGLRFLAVAESTKDIAALRAWADPQAALPRDGQQPPMPHEWEIAQSALRYVGWLKDPTSWGTLEKMMKRRDPKIDVTMESLMGSGLGLLGMSLRAIEFGAADGFAQWGDPKAYPLLVKLIEDEKENEQSRGEACFALAWVATDENMSEVAKKVHDFSGKEPKKQFIRGCYLETLIRRPVAGTAAGLVDMLTAQTDVEVRHQVARAIGFAGLDDKLEAQLFEKLKDAELRNDAALALVLGGSEDVAVRAVASYGDAPREALDELKDIYYRTFGYFSDEDFAKGRLYKWVAAAEAIARIRVRDTQQDWARLRLGSQFESLDFDNGPRSMTRVVLRSRLVEAARKGDAAARKGAIQTLKFMKEQGALMALRNESGETGELAKKAFFELMNPKVVVGEVVPQKNEGKGGAASP